MDKLPFFLLHRVNFAHLGVGHPRSTLQGMRSNVAFEAGAYHVSILIGTDVHPHQQISRVPEHRDLAVAWREGDINVTVAREVSDIEILVRHTEDEQFNDQWPKRLTDPVKLCILLGLVAQEPNPSRLMEKIDFMKLFD